MNVLIKVFLVGAAVGYEYARRCQPEPERVKIVSQVKPGKRRR